MATGLQPPDACSPDQTIPTTTVARRLPPSTIPLHASVAPSGGAQRYSSDRRAVDFHPHDWERAKLSGADANRSWAVPRADAHEIEKYA
jgi:hypothetical protein